MMTLLGMSEKSRYLPSAIQTGPSDHLKPSASFSILASLGISLSKRGSLRSIVPKVGYGFLSSLLPCGAARTRRLRDRPERRRRLRMVLILHEGERVARHHCQADGGRIVLGGSRLSK